MGGKTTQTIAAISRRGGLEWEISVGRRFIFIFSPGYIFVWSVLSPPVLTLVMMLKICCVYVFSRVALTSGSVLLHLETGIRVNLRTERSRGMECGIGMVRLFDAWNVGILSDSIRLLSRYEYYLSSYNRATVWCGCTLLLLCPPYSVCKTTRTHGRRIRAPGWSECNRR